MFKQWIILGMFSLAMMAGTAWAGGDAAAGEAKAANCAGCHGAAGEGMGDTPRLAGLDQKAHIAMLKEYKEGARGEGMMQMFAAQLSEEDMCDIAAYYAGLGGE
jgi:cytochrome c553